MDREILRSLAGQIAEIAQLDVQKRNMELYRAVNDLHMIRPVVLLAELPWNQLEASCDDLRPQCEDPALRGMEREMRRTLWQWNHCRADAIVEPFFRVPRAIRIGDIGVDVSERTIESDLGNNIISHEYIDQFPDMESVEKLHVPTIEVDDAETQRRFERADGLFGDILPIHLTGLEYAGFYSPWDDLARWRGVTPIYEDLYDDPEKLHALMRKLTAIQEYVLDQEEKLGLIEAPGTQVHCTAGLSESLPGDVEGGVITRRNIWGRGKAQMFGDVSHAMTDEFEIEYMKDFYKGFGLVYYGCCEPLHNKIDIVSKIPNLRKISITPWADQRVAAERIGSRYVLARKPNPAAVAVPHLDKAALRREILETLTVCKANNVNVEFTLKDISSVGYNPQNLTDWADTVMETVLNF